MTKKTSYNYDTTPIDGSLRPVRDLLLIREETVLPTGLIQPAVDLNRTTPWLYGIVEAVGPLVEDCRVGDRVMFPAGCGEFRVPGDDDVRIIKEEDVAGVCEPTLADRLDDLNGPQPTLGQSVRAMGDRVRQIEAAEHQRLFGNMPDLSKCAALVYSEEGVRPVSFDEMYKGPDDYGVDKTDSFMISRDRRGELLGAVRITNIGSAAAGVCDDSAA